MRMGRTLAELGETMSSAEFSMWAELCGIEPWDEHVDFGLGQVASVIGNYAGKVRADDAPPLRPSDFMPLPAPPPDVVEEPDPIAFFKAL